MIARAALLLSKFSLKHARFEYEMDTFVGDDAMWNAFRFNRATRCRRFITLFSQMQDVPSFAEVDYFTLSAVIIREIDRFSDLNPLIARFSYGAILKMFNWKYIN